MDEAERKLRGRIGAHALHASHDSREVTAKARLAFRQRLENQVDPEGALSPEERARRAEHALQAHMARMSPKAAQVRSQQKRNRAE